MKPAQSTFAGIRPAAVQHASVDASMIIDGAPSEAASRARYAIFNPADGRMVGTVPLAGRDDAARALRVAQAAREKWRHYSISRRIDIVGGAIDAVEFNTASIAMLLTREQGKPLSEAVDELGDFIERMRVFLRLARRTTDGHVPLLRSAGSADGRLSTGRIDGVTLGLVAWNFPVGLLAKKIGPALLAGGTIVLKPASTTPLATIRVVEHMNAAGVPPGVLNCVTGDGKDVGAALAASPTVDRIHLTGDDVTGAAVRSRAAHGHAELLLELAGSDPMIVCRDADVGDAIDAAMRGRFRNAGQACSAVKRLYVDSAIYHDVATALAREIRRMEPGDGLVPTTPPRVRLGPVHTAGLRDRLEAQLEDAVRGGARVLAGGTRPDRPELARGHFLDATLVADVPETCRLVTEEVFGPVLPIVKCAGPDDAIEKANRSQWHLNAYIWTSSADTTHLARQRLKCRQLWINRLSFIRARLP